ncbi:major facilitator superfamily protein [Klebsormidium nitens]|uniref:Lysosomal dipeptide transporter MFSD1 n=1 Tax=Klebsormidium nitens TaxID=105231 RepID=A0A1Y1IC93_KLENI|nr:major facilitator superfamily protein [Klebsormidium nitens]|eukprot:GAQ86326.1 major facilitator superfamily protein [Klebsormidium nitens]
MMQRSDLKSRWVVLVLTAVILAGSYFNYDGPAALKAPLQETLHLSDTQYNLLYSVYSFPNIVLPLFGGLLVDRCGTKASLILFVSTIVLGQGIFAAGVALRRYDIALVGRTVFGMGGESLTVVQTTIQAVWFQGKEMAFAMGLGLTVARLGSVINDWVMPAIYQSGVPGLLPPLEPASALSFGFFITLLSLGCALALLLLEVRTDRFLAAQHKREQAQPLLHDTAAGAEAVVEHMSLADIQHFSASYWLLTVSCVVVYATILPFNNVAAGVIMGKYGVSLEVADRLMSIPYLIAACINPFMGTAVDLLGYRAVMLTAGAAALAAVHLSLAWTMVPVVLPLVAMGLSYSAYAAAIWPSIALVVDGRAMGTAFGLTTAVQNGGMASMPIAVGTLRDTTGSYQAVEIFFACVAMVGVAVGVALNVVNHRAGGGLNRVAKRRDALEKKLEAVIREDLEADSQSR